MKTTSERLEKAYGQYWHIVKELLYKDEFLDESKINWIIKTN